MNNMSSGLGLYCWWKKSCTQLIWRISLAWYCFIGFDRYILPSIGGFLARFLNHQQVCWVLHGFTMLIYRDLYNTPGNPSKTSTQPSADLKISWGGCSTTFRWGPWCENTTGGTGGKAAEILPSNETHRMWVDMMTRWWQLTYFLFSSRTLGTWSNLRSIFFRLVETTNQMRILILSRTIGPTMF